MSSELIINSSRDKSRIGLLKDKKLVEFHQETDETKFNVGDIYVGKVKKINKSLNAAFIDIGFEKDAFLHYLDLGPQFLSLKSFVKKTRSKGKSTPYDSFSKLEDINKFGKITEVLKKGDELLIQIVKEPISTKGPRVTTELSLAGRYLILVSFSEAINISKKITNREERLRLINLIKSIRPKNFGVIVRTVAEEKSVSELDKDLKTLISTWKEGIKKIKKAKVGEKVIGEENKATSLLRDILNSSFDNIVIDDKDLFEEVKDYVKKFEPKKEKIVKYYSSPAPIFEVYGIEKQLQDLFGETVPISNGGYVIIQHTEALHAIDVNSGKFVGKKLHEENSLKINLEAAREVARQLRLRDLSGLVVIDFIDMRLEENRKKIYHELRKELRKDRAKVAVSPITEFGLLEMTRQRIRVSLLDSMSEECPTCYGSGRIISKETLITRIEHWLRRYKSKHRDLRIILQLHEENADYIKNDKKNILRGLMWKNFVHIKIETNKDVGRDEFRFIKSKTGKDITNEMALDKDISMA